MKYKYLIGFELSKVIIALFNIIFLVENYPEISIIISVLSILSSFAVVAVASGVAASGAARSAAGVAASVLAGVLAGGVAASGVASGVVAVVAVVAASVVAAKEMARSNKSNYKHIQKLKGGAS